MLESAIVSLQSDPYTDNIPDTRVHTRVNRGRVQGLDILVRVNDICLLRTWLTSKLAPLIIN